jgi:hypothetical protein
VDLAPVGQRVRGSSHRRRLVGGDGGDRRTPVGREHFGRVVAQFGQPEDGDFGGPRRAHDAARNACGGKDGQEDARLRDAGSLGDLRGDGLIR